MSFNKSTFSSAHFDRNSFTCSCTGGEGGGGESLREFEFGHFISRLPSDGAAGIAVKGLKCRSFH